MIKLPPLAHQLEKLPMFVVKFHFIKSLKPILISTKLKNLCRFVQSTQQRNVVSFEQINDSLRFLLSCYIELVQFWVFYQETPLKNFYSKHLQTNFQVEPSIRSSSSVLSSFKFTDMDLGSVTPEIVGIKVYSEEQTRHDEIVMDMQITWVV